MTFDFHLHGLSMEPCMEHDEIDAYALEHGRPPSAAQTVLVDFDKTIRPWGALLSMESPFPGAAEAVRDLKRAGYRVVILTSRASQSWWHDEAIRRDEDWRVFGEKQMAYVGRYLYWYGIPYDEITSEKVPGLAFFDDSAIRISENYPLAEAVKDFLAGQGQ